MVQQKNNSSSSSSSSRVTSEETIMNEKNKIYDKKKCSRNEASPVISKIYDANKSHSRESSWGQKNSSYDFDCCTENSVYDIRQIRSGSSSSQNYFDTNDIGSQPPKSKVKKCLRKTGKYQFEAKVRGEMYEMQRGSCSCDTTSTDVDNICNARSEEEYAGRRDLKRFPDLYGTGYSRNSQ